MTGKLCILGCRNFHGEVVAAIEAEEWEEVVTVDFPSRCGHPRLTWSELRSLLPEDCNQFVVIGRACLSALGEPPSGFPQVRIVHLEQCFHLVAGHQLVNEIISNGGYLITPGWLADWRKQLEMMGFELDQAGEFFQEFARELVLLDTGILSESSARLNDLGEILKLPVHRIAVGLDTIRLFLARLVLEWRLEQAQRVAKDQQRHLTREMADMVAAMDVLTRLAGMYQEQEAIAAIEDLFRMLFAPEALYYLRVENDISIPVRYVPDEMLKVMRGLSDDYALMPGGKGFLIRISNGDEVLGMIALDGLAFSEYRDRYLNMALAVTGVCGLAIENARNRRRLIEAEKMASLAILVAGVAHEINTPLGVGLTAASTLHRQGESLSQRFSERSMTQSDLEHYLATVSSATRLILDNLERVGHLVEAFRDVAVNGESTAVKQIFRVRETLDEVILSLGDLLSPGHISINIQCDPQLEIVCRRDDWVSIFINLIGNSIKHGFKGRAHGSIDIRVAIDAKRMRVDYKDDGAGLAPETLAKIFDPFFTTDLQHGMGLGMHLVYNLITHRMGGSIQCDSQLGHGVHFHIEIPQ